jgi:predicted flap endonuclease-1-like 5' DNA nuclease
MAEASEQIGRELAVLTLLRARYHDDGYEFFLHPQPELLPDFLKNFQPDAIALKPGSNVCIEVQTRPSPRAADSLKKISRLFSGRSDWTFRVYFISDFENDLPELTLPLDVQIVGAISRAEKLIELGFMQEAFVASWILLEAAYRKLAASFSPRVGQPLTPTRMVAALQEIGELTNEERAHMQLLARLRSAVVHGDLSIVVTEADVRFLISKVRHLTFDAPHEVLDSGDQASGLARPSRETDPIATSLRDDRANLLKGPVFGAPDDLELIEGVGPMLRSLLYEIGVYYFWQIAEWTPNEVDWVENKLKHFGGRIARDNWISRARALAAFPGTAKRPGEPDVRRQGSQ